MRLKLFLCIGLAKFKYESKHCVTPQVVAQFIDPKIAYG